MEALKEDEKGALVEMAKEDEKDGEGGEEGKD